MARAPDFALTLFALFVLIVIIVAALVVVLVLSLRAGAT